MIKKYQLWVKWHTDPEFKFEKASNDLEFLLKAKEKIERGLPVEAKVLQVHFEEMTLDTGDFNSTIFECVGSKSSTIELGEKVKGVFIDNTRFRLTQDKTFKNGHSYEKGEELPINGHIWKWRVVKGNHEDFVFITESS